MSTIHHHDDDDQCGCCEGTGALTPLPAANRPGQASLRYRAGTHGAFLKTMLARLSSHDYAALAGLTTRDPGDPAIAMLDAWATVADVLTFYQERIANEGYLRTATDSRSILELGRLVSDASVLRPGRTASTYLAFELDPSAQGLSPAVTIPKGSRAQSLPGQGELPQTFETSEELTARAEWNALKPRMTKPIRIGPETREIYLKGTTTNLKTNDPLLFLMSDDDTGRVLRRVASVEPQFAQDCTKVTLQYKVVVPPGRNFVPEVHALRVSASIFGHNAPLRPVTNKQGAIIGREEWTLRRAGVIGKRELSVELKPVQVAGTTGVQITVRVDKLEAGVASTWPISGTIKIEVKDSLDIVVETVEVSLDKKTGLGFHFTTNSTTFRAQMDTDTILRVKFLQDGKELPTDSCWVRLAYNVPFLRSSAAFGASIVIPPGHDYTEESNVVYLDASYQQIAPGSWAVIEKPNGALLITTIVAADNETPKTTEESRADYGISGRCTRLVLPVLQGQKSWIDPKSNDFSVIRGSIVHTQSEKLELAEAPDTDQIKGQEIALTGRCTNPGAGRQLIMDGIDADSGDHVAEVAVLDRVDVDGDHSILHLKEDLSKGEYRRDTVTIYANVVHAHHGQTCEEMLGSADASQPSQEFRLGQKPLSFDAANTPQGAKSTLEVFVNDQRWDEVERLSDHGPSERVYITRTDEENNVTVRFGDGHQGMRPPTGTNNITAKYCTGIGEVGNVLAKQISQLVDRPLGVKGVSNPMPVTDGADRDTEEEVRWNLPLYVTALGRVVSTQDYEDFARTFAGVVKAKAVHSTNKKKVQLTIAGTSNASADTSSLREALEDNGASADDFEIGTCKPIFLGLQAKIGLQPDYLWEKVKPQVRAAVLDAFSFQRRELGQDAVCSEVTAVIQGVPGVAYVDINNFQSFTEQEIHGPLPWKQPPDAVAERVTVAPAQIAYFLSSAPETLILNEVSIQDVTP